MGDKRWAMGKGLDPLRRVAIERVRPEVDCGRFPIKRSIGDRVIVSADIHADGHDVLAAVLLFRKAGASGWHEVPMLGGALHG